MKKNRQIRRYLRAAITGQEAALLALIALQILLALATVAFVMAMRSALDGAAARDRSALQAGLVGMVILILGRMALHALFRCLDEGLRATVENNLKGRLLHHLLQGDYAQVDAVHTGEWMNRLTSDTTVVATGIAEILPGLLGMLVKLIGAAVMIIAMLPQIAVFLLPAGGFAVVITWALRKSMKKQHKAVQERDGRLRTYLQEHLGSMMIVRAFCAEPLVEASAAQRMGEHKRARLRRNLISTVCNTGFAGLMNGLYVLGFVYCGYGILAGSVTYGTLLAVIQLIGQIQTPFAGLSGIVPRYYAMTASAERLLEAEHYAADCGDHGSDSLDFAAIHLAHVDFAYPGSEAIPVLRDTSLTIARGDYLAITGQSGCGKSTIFKLLLSLYRPTAGEILLEASDGSRQPITPAHRPLFAYVPQGNHLMSGSIRDAVTFAQAGEADDERIRQALRIACADEVVESLDGGLDAELGERGCGLSEGQMQRLAIARAIYTDAPILLLDEATSALDEQTERQVLANLRTMTDKTVLIVTHRPAALAICNRRLAVGE